MFSLYLVAMLIQGIAAVTAILVAGRLPRAWREHRWALRYGDPDERRAGWEIWWESLARLAGVSTFAAGIAGVSATVFAGLGIAYCAAVVVARIR